MLFILPLTCIYGTEKTKKATMQNRHLFRRLRPVIPRIAERVAQQSFPMGGMILSAFESRCAFDVAPEDVPELLKLLHRRGIVWVRQHRGAVMVYREKPERAPAPMAIGNDLMDRFIGAVAPAVAYANHTLAGPDSHPDQRYQHDVACGRVIEVVRRYARKGLNLEEARHEMWMLFPEPVMRRVAWHDPRLAREATETDMPAHTRTPKRLPSGLSFTEKVVALVGKAGSLGITKSNLCRAIAPAPKAEEMVRELEHLEAKRVIKRLPMAPRMGRPGVRWVLVESWS